MKIKIVLSLLIFLALQVSAEAQYLQLEGVNGGSTDAAHMGWIEFESYALGPHLLQIKITKQADKSTPKLLEYVVQKTKFSHAQIEFVTRIGGEMKVYERIELRDVRITAFNQIVGGNSALSEEILIVFGRITLSYTEYDSVGKKKGTVEVMYDRDTFGNQKITFDELRKP